MTAPGRASWASRSQWASLSACQIPLKSGFPSAVRGTAAASEGRLLVRVMTVTVTSALITADARAKTTVEPLNRLAMTCSVVYCFSAAFMTSLNCATYPSFFAFTFTRTNTTRDPSGETCGSPIHVNWNRSVSVIGRFDWAASVPPTIETMKNAAVGRNRRRMRTPSAREVYPRSQRSDERSQRREISRDLLAQLLIDDAGVALVGLLFGVDRQLDRAARRTERSRIKHVEPFVNRLGLRDAVLDRERVDRRHLGVVAEGTHPQEASLRALHRR